MAAADLCEQPYVRLQRHRDHLITTTPDIPMNLRTPFYTNPGEQKVYGATCAPSITNQASP